MNPSKNINTLIPDIYKVLSEGATVKEEALQEFTKQLGELLKKRLDRSEERSNVLRMSNFGTPCERELWYRVNTPEKAEPLQPWVLFKFLYGDILELLVLFLAREAGHTVEGEQDEMELEGLVGHRDGVIDGVLVDVKSAAPMAMGKFRSHALESDDPFGYLDQLGLYLAAGQADPKMAVKGEAAFLAVDKAMGHLVLDTYRLKPKDWSKEIRAKRAMLAEKFPPNRPYFPVSEGKSGNMVIPTKCSYCQFKNECWKDANNGKGLIEFVYSTGPKWFTKIDREPRVEKKNVAF